MKLVNRSGVPAPIEAAARSAFSKERDRGGARYTVTELIMPPQMVQLERRFDAEIEIDVADMIYALLGVLMARLIATFSGDHLTAIMEAAAALPPLHREVLKSTLWGLGYREGPLPVQDVIAERRLIANFTLDGESVKVSGQMDHVLALRDPAGWHITDWKLGSVYEWMDTKPEREAQLNLYAALLRWNGYYPVVSASNGFIFRDWSKRKARRERYYPRHQFENIPARIWPVERASMFLMQRLAEHISAETNTPECTRFDKWQKPEGWAVMKRDTSKRASAVRGSESDAVAWLDVKRADEKGWEKAWIQHRPTEPVRCLDYCRAAPFCAQHAREFPKQSGSTALPLTRLDIEPPDDIREGPWPEPEEEA